MKTETMFDEIRNIEMPESMKVRIVNNCLSAAEGTKMRTHTYRKPALSLASFVLCFILVGLTVTLASGKLTGFFHDVTDWRHAVTGTAYEEASDEVDICLNDREIVLTMLKADAAPYSEIDEICISSYRVEDENGKTVIENGKTSFVKVNDGSVSIRLEEELPESGKIVITELTGRKKADQDLPIHGTWVIEFSK